MPTGLFGDFGVPVDLVPLRKLLCIVSLARPFTYPQAKERVR